MARNKDLEVGTKLEALTPGSQNCEIILIKQNPRKYRVKYDSGKTAYWSKSHLKKYYKAV